MSKVKPKYHAQILPKPIHVGRHMYTHQLFIVTSPRRPPNSIFVGRFNWRHKEGKTYSPNGPKECLRRRRQMDRDGTVGASTITDHVDGPDGTWDVREFVDG